MATKLGTAYVDVVANFSPFDREVAAHMSGAFDGKAIGKAMSASIGKGFDIGETTEKELKRSTARLKTVASEAGRDIGAELVRGLKDAKTEVNAFARDGMSSFNALRRVSSDVTGGIDPVIKKVNLFARDGSASFTKLARVAQGASADITGSFDPLSKALQRVSADMTGAIQRASKSVGGVGAESTGAIQPFIEKINLFGRDGTASFKAVGSSARTANAETKRLYDQITKSNISRALGDIGSAGTRAGKDIEAGARRGSNAVRNLNRDANRGGGGGGVANALGAIGGELPGGVAALGGLRIALVLVVPALFAFGGAAGAAASALVPLIGLAAGAGGVLSSLAQGFGVLKLATSGIGAALKEQTSGQIKAGTSAINAASQQRSAARSIQSAQDSLHDALDRVTSSEENLADAQKSAKTTQKALTAARTSARRALVDMHSSLQDAVLGERSAALALTDAQQALSDLDTTADQQDVRVAVQAVTEAFHGQQQAALSLLRAQQSLDDLLKKSAGDESTRASTAAALGRAQANLALVTADANATYDERTHALTLVADATKAVNDANAASTVTDLDKAEALQAVTSAQDGIVDAQNQAIATQKALSDLQAGPSDMDKRRALLDVQRAVQDLVEAQRDAARQAKDTAEADRLGVEKSKEVVDAKAAIVDADKRVRDAEKAVQDAHLEVTRATQALADAQLAANEALTKGAESSANLNKAMDALPPAAQAFVRELVQMKPKLDDLRQTAAKGFFPGATAGLHAAMGSFSEIKSVIGETSTVLGDFTRKLGELVGSPAFGKDLKTIGHDNAKVLDTLGEALRHIISAIRYVLLAAAPLTQWLADTINDWSQYAASSAKAGEETGKLGGFFEKTRAIAERLGDIIGHIAHGLWGVAGAGDSVGNDLWKSIDRVAKRFDDWANSAKGKKEIHEFFQKATDLAKQIAKALGEVVKGIAFLILKFLPLTDALKAINPYIDELVAAFVAAKLAMYAASAASAIVTGAMWLLETPIALIVLALAALAYGFYYAYTHSDTFRAIVDGVLQSVGDKLKWLWNAAQDVFNWMKDNWPALFGIVTVPIKLAVDFIIAHWDWVQNATTNVWNFLSGFLSSIWNGIKSAASWIFNAIASVIGGVWSAISSVAQGAWRVLKSAAELAWDGIKAVIISPIRWLVKGIGDVWDDLAKGAGKAWDLLVKSAKAFAGSIADAVTGAFEGVANVVIDFINDIIAAINVIPGIPNIDKIDHIGGKKTTKSDSTKSGPEGTGKTTDRKAEGGAYGRTGGFVGAPITLMGEEAPRHPEWVIPTNPLYRARAQMLLAQAAQSIGLAKGGMFSQTDMENLWAKHGGGDKKIAGAVGMAESHGDPNASNGPYHGLWQIGPGGPFDPDQNAIAGIAKWRASGWAPWEAYTGPDGTGSDGPWRQYTGGGNIVSSIIGKVGGVLGDILSKGAGFILNMLPGVGKLPEWLKGAGSWVLSHVTDWVGDKLGNLIGGGTKGPKGVGTFSGVPMANWVIEALTYAREHGAHGSPTSGYRPGFDTHTASGKSEHQGTQFPHGAVDFGGFTAGLAEKMSYVQATRDFKYPLLAPIGFRDDGHASGTGHYMGGLYGGLPYKGSFAMGGIVGGPTGAAGLATVHGGEAVVPDGANLVGALNRHSAELRALRQAGVSGVMASITDHVLGQGGQDAQRRRMTAGNPAVTAILG